MPSHTKLLDPNDPAYPSVLSADTTTTPPPPLHAIGDPALLRRPYLGLFASVKCPGDAILRAYDLARELRDAEVSVIGGFHSPMEKECLDLLLRGSQPVVVVPARGIDGMRVPTAWRPAIDTGRLLILSPFDPSHNRITAALAGKRNAFVERMSAALLVIHAAPGSATERLALASAAAGKPVFLATAAAASPALASTGAVPADVRAIKARLC